jgi:hypothetical protein
MSQRINNLSSLERTISALLGLGLSLLTRRSGSTALRALTGLAGAALLARAYAGHCGLKAAVMGQTSLRDGLSEQWKRIADGTIIPKKEAVSSAHAGQSRAFDESSDESPASDPPASRAPGVRPVNAEAKSESSAEPKDGGRFAT